MASEAFAGVGTKFQRWDGAAWQDIAEVNSIDGPGMTKDVLEVTSLDTDAGYNEFITRFAEGGTLTLDMNFTRETYELMKEDFESDEVRSYRIQLSDYDLEPSTFTIEGLVIELPITMTADDKVTADVVIQITSQVVLEEDSWSSYWKTLLAKFATPNNEKVSMQRTDNGSATGTTYYLRNRIVDNICNAHEWFSILPVAEGDEKPYLYFSYVEKIIQLRTDVSTPAITLSGTWTKNNSTQVDERRQTLGGRWCYSKNAGVYIEYQTENYCNELYLLQVPSNTTGGLCIVSIDGDRTLADALPTAQALVDAGTFPDTILVANGGPFNPTDRALDLYTNRALYNVPLATGLTPGVHTLKIERSGLKHASATDTYLWVTAVGVGRTNISLADTALYFRIHDYVYNYLTTIPRNEFAYSIRPTGASDFEWVGHINSCKLSSVPVFKADGEVITPANGSITTADEISISYECDTYHSEVGGGALSIGTIAVEMVFNKETGLTINNTYTLGVGGLVSGYPCMLSFSENLNKLSYFGAVADYSASANDKSEVANHSGQSYYAWDEDGRIAVMMYIPSLDSVDNWANSGDRQFYALDQDGWNKFYAQRFSMTAFEIGAVWQSSCNYRIMWFPGGADAELTNE